MKRTSVFVALLAGVALAGTALAGKARSGEEVYNTYCAACHGISTGPMVHDQKAWAPFVDVAMKGATPLKANATAEEKLAQQAGQLLPAAKKGVLEKGMPPNGGCPDCTDGELTSAVQFMIAPAPKK